MNDKYPAIGHAYEEIGRELAEIVGGDPDGVYLYAEAGDGWIGSSLFRDEGNAVRYYDTTDELDDLLVKFRNTKKPGKRWTVMEYEIIGTKFDARFKYPEEVEVEFFDDDRREIALKRRYGDNPIIYPPWPGQPTE